MKRRIIPLILIVALIPALLAVPVYAADYDNFGSWVNLFDYRSFDNEYEGNNTYWNDFSAMKIRPVDNRTPIYYFDVLFTTNVAFDKFGVYYGSGLQMDFNVVKLDWNLYRAYGRIGGYGMDFIHFYINTSATSGYVSFLNVRYSTSGKLSFDMSATFDMVCWKGVYNMTYTPGEGSYVMISGTTDYTEAEFGMSVYPTGWQKYDYIDVLVTVSANSITSINADVGSVSVPISYSYLDNTTIVGGTQFVYVRCDLTGIDRSSGTLQLVVMGQLVVADDSFTNLVGIQGVTGYVDDGTVSPFVFWMRQIRKSINESFSSLKGWIEAQTDAIVNALNPSSDSSASDDLVNKGQQIEDFESQHQDVINNGVGSITDTLNLTGVAPALSLISSYVGSTFDILGPYQQVIILPIAIGIIMFICSRSPGLSVPRSFSDPTQHSGKNNCSADNLFHKSPVSYKSSFSSNTHD